MHAESSGIWSDMLNSNPADDGSNQGIIPTDEQVISQDLVHPDRSNVPNSIVAGYHRMLEDRIRQGWTCDLVTITFNRVKGSPEVKRRRMIDDVILLYSRLVTRTTRKPRRADVDQLPLFIGAVDFPVFKHDRTLGPQTYQNDGLHVHLLVALPPYTRLREPLANHVRNNPMVYMGDGTSIQNVHFEPVTDFGLRLVDYVFKAVTNHRVDYDDGVIVLPRSRRELT